jgi:transcriptional regulator with XRE-family HTH domain
VQHDELREKLLITRRELNLTTQQLAKYLGVTESYIRSIERYARFPTTAKKAYEKVVNFVKKVD